MGRCFKLSFLGGNISQELSVRPLFAMAHLFVRRRYVRNGNGPRSIQQTDTLQSCSSPYIVLICAFALAESDLLSTFFPKQIQFLVEDLDGLLISGDPHYIVLDISVQTFPVCMELRQQGEILVQHFFCPVGLCDIDKTPVGRDLSVNCLDGLELGIIQSGFSILVLRYIRQTAKRIDGGFPVKEKRCQIVIFNPVYARGTGRSVCQFSFGDTFEPGIGLVRHNPNQPVEAGGISVRGFEEYTVPPEDKFIVPDLIFQLSITIFIDSIVRKQVLFSLSIY